MITLADFQTRVQGVHINGKGFTCKCPSHDDRHNSLSVSRGDDGRILLHCHAGCSYNQIIAALGLSRADLTPRKDDGKRIVTIYDYRDETGNVLFQTVRYRPKDFRQRHPDGRGGWVWNLEGVRRLLYRLPELLAADPTCPVFIVEGEKDADNLARLNLISTTAPMGAGKWRTEYSEFLRGRQVVILPDNDKAGLAHAGTIEKSLAGIAASVKTVKLPGPGKDFSDWLSAGGTREDLLELVSQAAIASLHESDPAGSDKEPSKLSAQRNALAELPLTDAGNGEAFALLFEDRVRYDHRRRKWLIWESPLWREDSDGEVQRLAIECARARLRAAADIDDQKERARVAHWALQSEGLFRRRAMLESASILKPIADAGAWDTDPWLIGCENGVLDLRHGVLVDGDPSQRITRSTGIRFDSLAECPRWDAFLTEVFESDDLIEYVKRAVGYSLSGDVSEQVLFLLHGLGANGKSVFLAILRALLGSYSTNTPFTTFEWIDRNGATNDLAALAGMRLVTSSETRESTKLNEARVKAMTGGDSLTARFLFGEFFTFEPQAKIWIAVNHKPAVSDDTHGFWRRVRLIPFNRQFGPETADSHLVDKLQQELPGILRWALEGCLDWQNRGLQPPDIVTQATAEYRAEQDSVSTFLSEVCVVDSNAQVAAQDLFDAFTAWCVKRKEAAMTQTAFGRRMTDRGYEKDRKSVHGIQATVYLGIGLAK